jgi:UDP-GlcNAc:undecaprenyl-phosphate GlcNAc-1-phosphate transferase
VGAGARPFRLLPDAFAVWAAINAFNMVDGIDGLLGGLSSVSFAAIGIILWFDGQYSLAMWCFAMIAAILPYILLTSARWAVAIKSLWVMPAAP